MFPAARERETDRPWYGRAAAPYIFLTPDRSLRFPMAKASNRRRSRTPRRQARLVFARKNYVILLASLALVVAGYTLMRVENEVDGFLSLVVSPLMILGGYLGVIVAILWREAPDAESA